MVMRVETDARQQRYFISIFIFCCSDYLKIKRKIAVGNWPIRILTYFYNYLLCFIVFCSNYCTYFSRNYEYQLCNLGFKPVFVNKIKHKHIIKNLDNIFLQYLAILTDMGILKIL